MTHHNEAMKLNLLVLEEEEKERKKNQPELINIEESAEPFKTVKTRGRRKLNLINEELLKNENEKDVEEADNNSKLDENKKRISPRKRSKNQLAENNKKMTDIFKVDTPVKMVENVIESQTEGEEEKKHENLDNAENEEKNEEDAAHIGLNEEDKYSSEDDKNGIDEEDDEEYNVKKGLGKTKKPKKKKPRAPKEGKKCKETKTPKAPKIPKEKPLSKGKSKKENTEEQQETSNSQAVKNVTKIGAEIQPDDTPKTYETIIDLDELNANNNISNSDMILAIIEICVNSAKYGILKENKTREFWKQVYDKPEWENILKKFQSETLRKYWRIIRDVNNITKFIETVHNYADKLNGNNVKLLPVINTISSFISSKAKSFDLYEKQLTSPQNLSVTTKEKNKLTDPLNKKRHREDGIIDDIKEMKKKIMETDKKKKSTLKEVGKEDSSLSKGNVNETVFITSGKKKKNKIEELTEKDEEDCKDIDEIITNLSKSFEGKTENEILEIFKNTSFNIQNAYLFLTDPEYFKELGYSEPDDKIIKKLEKSTAYAKLVQLKGNDSIEERKKFLKMK